MGILKGSREFAKFKRGEKLSRKQAMLAKCYECNGEEESGTDCEVETCALYLYHTHRKKAKKSEVMELAGAN